MFVKAAKYLTTVSLFGLAYFLLGEIGLQIDTGFRGVTPVWFPSGLALLIFLWFGVHYWPGIFIGIALLAYNHGIPPGVAIIAASGNSLEAYLAYYLLQRYKFDHKFKHTRDVLKFSAIGFAAPLVAGVLGSLAMTINRGASWNDFAFMSSIWWLGDATGILLLVPLVLVWQPRQGYWALLKGMLKTALQLLTPAHPGGLVSVPAAKNFLQLLALLSGLLLVSWLSFSPVLVSEHAQLAYFYLIMPLTVLAAICKTQKGATLAALFVSMTLFYFYNPDIGLFSLDGERFELLLVVAFVCVTAITALAVSSLFSERRDAEQSLLESHNKLAESEQRFRQISENIREVFWLTDAKTQKVIYVSPSYEEVWGIPREDLYKDAYNWMASIHPDDRDEVTSQYSELWKTGKFDVEYRVIKPDGEIRYIHDKGFPIDDEQGNIYRFTGLAEDITERKEFEKQMYSKSEELSKLARFVSVGELGNSLAHEINQPLTSIACYASGMLNRYKVGHQIDAELYEVFAKLGNEAGRAGSIINKLRHFVSRDEVKYSTADINMIIKDTIKLIEHKLDSSKVQVNYDLPEDIPLIIVDSVLVQQALLNLVINAIEAMEQNEINTKGLLISTQHENDKVIVRVSDKGPGVPYEYREVVMNPLFTTKEHGVGLGLSISLRIIETMGGALRGYPNDTTGYTFEFCLPVQVAG